MHRIAARTLAVTAATALALTGTMPAQGDNRASKSRPTSVHTVTATLDGPRGVAAWSPRSVLVGQADGTVSLVVRRKHRPARVLDLTAVPNTGLAPAVARGRHHTVWILTTGGAPGAGAATLYRWHRGMAKPRAVADIAAHQAAHPDPFNMEGEPGESNPYGLAALRDGTVLVADAAGNDLLRVWPSGKIRTVAMLKPRTVPVPSGLPATDPEGNPLPPAGAMIPAEAVATSVTVGKDGYWYVGELRGFPATPGTSQIWRIRPGAKSAVCDPERPWRGACKRFADGLTSLVDLAPGGRRSIHALSLSKQSWLQMELGTPGAEIGGLFRVHRHRGVHVREIARGKLVMPGGVDRAPNGDLYVTTPVFGPGKLLRIH